MEKPRSSESMATTTEMVQLLIEYHRGDLSDEMRETIGSMVQQDADVAKLNTEVIEFIQGEDHKQPADLAVDFAEALHPPTV